MNVEFFQDENDQILLYNAEDIWVRVLESHKIVKKDEPDEEIQEMKSAPVQLSHLDQQKQELKVQKLKFHKFKKLLDAVIGDLNQNMPLFPVMRKFDDQLQEINAAKNSEVLKQERRMGTISTKIVAIPIEMEKTIDLSTRTNVSEKINRIGKLGKSESENLDEYKQMLLNKRQIVRDLFDRTKKNSGSQKPNML